VRPSPQEHEAPPPHREHVADEEGLQTLKDLDKVLAAARAHLGKTTVRVNGKSFRYDCSGYVRGMFWAAGLDLMSEGAGDTADNDGRVISKHVERHGQTHFRKKPRRGDIVYFDNTWDKNGNGLLDDPLTHIGIVEEVDEDGTIHILHRANRGIVRDVM